MVQAVIHEATLGMGSVLMFAGDRGIGKSRFLAECSRLAESALSVTAHLRANSTSGSKLISQLARALRVTGRRRMMPPAMRVQEAIIEKSRRKTIVILIDDVHLAGSDEITALESLMQLTRGSRVAIIGCFTNQPQVAWRSLPPWADRRPDATICVRSLQPLERVAIELLVRSLVKGGPKNLIGDVTTEIVRTAEGSPLFAVELVACATQFPLSSPLIPSSAHAIAAAARKAMTKSAFEILAACSVVGSSFRDEWIIEILEAQPSAIADTLQSGTDLGLLAEQAGVRGWYSFRHVAVRKALSSWLVSLRQQMLHERIATCISGPMDDPVFVSLMAPHWDSLQNHDLAAEYLSRAGDELEGKAAYALAAELYDRATAHARHGSDMWRSLMRRLVHCYERLGEWGSMIPHLRSMLATLDAPTDAEGAGVILSALFVAHLYNGDRASAQMIAAEMAELGLRERHQNALFGLALNLSYAGRREEARRIVGHVDPNALASDESRLDYHIACAEVDSLHEPLEKTLAVLETAIDLGRRVSKVGFSCDVAAEISLRFGDLNKARGYVQRATQSAEQSSGNATKRMAAHKKISLHFLEGDLTAARDGLISILEGQGSGAHNDSFRAGIGVLIGMHIGDLAIVDALFDPELLERAIKKGDADSCGLLLPAFAEVMHVRALDEELKRAVRRCIDDSLVDQYTWIQITAARFGPTDCIDQAARQMEQFLNDAVAPVAPAHTALFYAVSARRNGRRTAARAHGLDAAGRYRRIGWRLWEASALEAAGEFEKAVQVYQQCGACADVARLKAGRTRKRVFSAFGARLTPRELEVARLLVRKWSNHDIAQALAISVRTVDHHVEAAFSKLGVNSRWQLTDALLGAYREH